MSTRKPQLKPRRPAWAKEYESPKSDPDQNLLWEIPDLIRVLCHLQFCGGSVQRLLDCITSDTTQQHLLLTVIEVELAKPEPENKLYLKHWKSFIAAHDRGLVRLGIEKLLNRFSESGDITQVAALADLQRSNAGTRNKDVLTMTYDDLLNAGYTDWMPAKSSGLEHKPAKS